MENENTNVQPVETPIETPVEQPVEETHTEPVSEEPEAEETEQEEQEKPYIDDDGNLIKPEPKKVEETPKEEPKKEEVKETPKNTTFPERELKEVEQLYNRTIEDGVKEYENLRDSYLKKAGRPIVTVVDEATGREKQYYADYTAEQAFQYGIETGNYDPFLTSLTPLEVRNFLRDKDKIDSKYDGELSNLEKEKRYKQLVKEKQEDLAKWNDYIKPISEENPRVAYLLNKIKDESGFDKQIADRLVQWIKEADAIEMNKKTIKDETDRMKKAMHGENPPVAPQVKNYRNIPLKDISDEEYLANEAEIIRQKTGRKR